MARHFQVGRPICREDLVRRVDMDASIPDGVKHLIRQLQFDEATVDECGEITLDAAEKAFSDG